MTKKDYIKAAEQIRGYYYLPETDRKNIATAFSVFFAADNPKFDRERFMNAALNGLIQARKSTKPRPMANRCHICHMPGPHKLACPNRSAGES